MGMAVYGVGDEVFYPQFTVRSNRTMKVVDRRVMFYNKSQKFYIRYLFDETL